MENNENNKTTNRGKMRRPPSRKGGDKRKFTEKTPERAPVLKNVKRVKRKIPPVRIVFLGGVGEIGKNMTALECGDDIIIIDAGAIFPTDETPGFDLIVPDITYLIENKSKVRGVILTHGHEDHIGEIGRASCRERVSDNV